MWPKPLTRIMLLALAGSSLFAPAASADSADCAAAPDPGRVIVTVDGDPTVNEAPTLFQRDGQVLIGDADDAGAVCGLSSSIDRISVRSADEPGYPGLLYIDTSEVIGPGATDEPGDSDEIEIDVDFVRGGGVGIRTSRGPLAITTGGRLVNLHRGEATGVDGDLTLRGVEYLYVETTLHRDVVDGFGGEGTGSKPGSFRIHSEAPVLDRAPDLLLGTSRMDHLYGGGGRDVIRGGAMRDLLYGGRGDDRLVGGLGPDFVRGGIGSDLCSDPGDRLRGCETGN